MRRLVALVVAGVALALPVQALAQAEVVEYYGLDAIGSVRIVFDANGAVTSRMDYGPFGEQVMVSTTVAKVYAGLFRDGEAGLDYAEARSYQVRTGRFSSPDPVYAGLFDPQGWNRYSYALNSPLLFTDPSGLCPIGKICTETVGKLPDDPDKPEQPHLRGREDVWWWTPFGTVFEIDWSHLDIPKMVVDAVNAPGIAIIQEIENTEPTSQAARVARCPLAQVPLYRWPQPVEGRRSFRRYNDTMPLRNTLEVRQNRRLCHSVSISTGCTIRAWTELPRAGSESPTLMQ